jgi:hypothetical protein
VVSLTPPTSPLEDAVVRLHREMQDADPADPATMARFLPLPSVEDRGMSADGMLPRAGRDMKLFAG